MIEPLTPPARRGGRRRSVDVRAVLNGVLYVLETGCQWRHLPKDLPPRSTCHGDLDLWLGWDAGAYPSRPVRPGSANSNTNRRRLMMGSGVEASSL